VKRTLTILVALSLTLAASAAAQVKPGEASLNLSATVSAGYSDETSNLAGSDHSIFGAGQADLSGFYYNPNFLSFDVQPFYNQSRLNSTYQSITAASGVSASARIFSGSSFPGSISYSSTFNSSGNFGIPGLSNYTTHGNSDILALTWGIHLSNLPSLNLTFSNGNTNYSVYGGETLGTQHLDTFSATSGYRVAGFNLNGGYEHVGTRSVMPEFLAGESSQQSDSGTNSFFLGVAHSLPWNGSFSASATHLKITNTYGDTAATDNYNTSLDTLTGALNFNPLSRLSVGGNAYYTDNLEGTLYGTLLTAGVTTPQTEPSGTSRDLTLTGNANYELPAQHLDFHGFIERQQQSFLGASYASTSYNGTATYSNRVLGGQLNTTLGLVRTTFDTNHQSLLGLNASLNYTHSIRHWNLAGLFSYSQDTQTVLINYTTSGYNYFGSAGRRIRRRSYWGLNAGGMRSLLTGQPGTANASQSYGTSFSLPWVTMSGTYSTSSGNALLTSTGLVATPIPVSALPSSAVVLYNGSSYSLGLSSNPIRGLTFSATYAKALSSTNSNSTLSNNNNENLYCLLMYHFRKLDFQMGYSRLIQGFSATGGQPARDNSFYVGVSRWFNFF
jgi:hypothetical protein